MTNTISLTLMDITITSELIPARILDASRLDIKSLKQLTSDDQEKVDGVLATRNMVDAEQLAVLHAYITASFCGRQLLGLRADDNAAAKRLASRFVDKLRRIVNTQD